MGSVRPAATGVWQPSLDVALPNGEATNPQVALGPQGDAVVVCRVYYVNGRVYSLTARAARARLDDGSVAKFLDS